MTTSGVQNRSVCICVHYLFSKHGRNSSVCIESYLHKNWQLQDFPSIYQVREKLIENDIITIFALGKNLTNVLQSNFDVYSVSVVVHLKVLDMCI